MRWCAFPGERLFRRVQMEVNGNPLDEYTFHAVCFHRDYRVAPNKVVGWDRCVGQEDGQKGFVSQPLWASNGFAPSEITSRVGAVAYTGNQTPSGQKTGSLEMFIPLLFWYNNDVRLAVPSVAIPYGQRFINIDLESSDNLYGLVPRGASTWAAPGGTLTDASTVITTFELYINNIFVNPEVHKIYIKRIGFSLIRVHRQQVYTVTSETSLLLNQLKWPIEWLYVGMKLKNYFAATTAEQKRRHLDKWQLFCAVLDQTYTTQGQDIMLEQQLVVTTAGTETLGVGQATFTAGAEANAALTGTAVLLVALAAGDMIRIGGELFRVAVGAAAGAAVTGVSVSDGPTVAITASTGNAAAALRLTMQGLQYTCQQQFRTVDTLNIKAHGIPIYDTFPSAFFNAYTSYHYGGPNINTPEDVGANFIPFCLYPGTYQPSGHINVSRAREFYIEWTSSIINTIDGGGNPNYDGSGGVIQGVLVVVASAINFLLISDGSAVLRYST